MNREGLPRWSQALLVIAVVLTAVSVLFQLGVHVAGIEGGEQVRDMFDLDKESNIPTWFASALLLASAVSSWLVSRVEPDPLQRRYWLVLAVVFVAFSIDESARLHEKLNGFGQFVDLPSAFAFFWVLPALVAVIVFGLWLVPFLRRLEPDLLRALVIAGGIYVLGALGLEFVEGALLGPNGEEGLAYELVANLQELMEMVGLILYLIATVGFLTRLGFRLDLSPGARLDAS